MRISKRKQAKSFLDILQHRQESISGSKGINSIYEHLYLKSYDSGINVPFERTKIQLDSGCVSKTLCLRMTN